MLELGAQEKWPAKYCERKWEELHPDTAAANPNVPTPGHHVSVQLGPPSAASHDNWMPQDQGSEFDYTQSTSSLAMISRSPVTFTTPITSRSPVLQSPGPIQPDHKFEQ